MRLRVLLVVVDAAKLQQTIFGHYDVVTCLTRSETYIAGDCYFVTGSRDATLMLWYWSGRRNRIIGDIYNTGSTTCDFMFTYTVFLL